MNNLIYSDKILIPIIFPTTNKSGYACFYKKDIKIGENNTKIFATRQNKYMVELNDADSNNSATLVLTNPEFNDLMEKFEKQAKNVIEKQN